MCSNGYEVSWGFKKKSINNGGNRIKWLYGWIHPSLTWTPIWPAHPQYLVGRNICMWLCNQRPNLHHHKTSYIYSFLKEFLKIMAWRPVGFQIQRWCVYGYQMLRTKAKIGRTTILSALLSSSGSHWLLPETKLICLFMCLFVCLIYIPPNWQPRPLWVVYNKKQKVTE